MFSVSEIRPYPLFSRKVPEKHMFWIFTAPSSVNIIFFYLPNQWCLVPWQRQSRAGYFEMRLRNTLPLAPITLHSQGGLPGSSALLVLTFRPTWINETSCGGMPESHSDSPRSSHLALTSCTCRGFAGSLKLFETLPDFSTCRWDKVRSKYQHELITWSLFSNVYSRHSASLEQNSETKRHSLMKFVKQHWITEVVPFIIASDLLITFSH